MFWQSGESFARNIAKVVAPSKVLGKNLAVNKVKFSMAFAMTPPVEEGAS